VPRFFDEFQIANRHNVEIQIVNRHNVEIQIVNRHNVKVQIADSHNVEVQIANRHSNSNCRHQNATSTTKFDLTYVGYHPTPGGT
jgi:uncharacterized HAD superfamily protein